MTEFQRIILLILAYVHRISFVFGRVMSALGRLTEYQWEGSIEHSVVGLCFFVPVAVLLLMMRARVKDRKTGLIMLISSVFILICSCGEVVELLLKLI